MTTESNAQNEPIHDRMPVILEEDEEAIWLTENDTDELQSVCDPYPDRDFEAYEITTKINNPANNSPDVIEPASTIQSGLGDF